MLGLNHFIFFCWKCFKKTVILTHDLLGMPYWKICYLWKCEEFWVVISNGIYNAIQMDDPIHLERFNHDCSGDFPLNAADLDRKRPQDFDFFLVFDLEGKVEILEFPVLMIDAKTVSVVDLFHRL